MQLRPLQPQSVPSAWRSAPHPHWSNQKRIQQRAMATRAQSEKMHSMHRRRTCAQLTTTECWICYQDEVDKSECLRRDCLCRDPDALALSASQRKNIEWGERDPDGSMSQLPPTLSEYAQIWHSKWVCVICREGATKQSTEAGWSSCSQAICSV